MAIKKITLNTKELNQSFFNKNIAPQVVSTIEDETSFRPNLVVPLKSAYNSSPQPAKCSAAIYAVEGLLKKKDIAVLESSDSIVVELQNPAYKSINLVELTPNGTVTIKSSLSDEYMVGYAITLLVSVLAISVSDEELMESMRLEMESISSTGTYKLDHLGRISDNIYFNFTKGISAVEFEVDDTLPQTVRQAFRSGELSTITALKALGIKSSLDLTSDIAEVEEKEVEEILTPEQVLERARAGEYCLVYDWDDVAKSHIPSLSALDDFIPSRHYVALVKKFEKKLSRISTRVDMGKNNLEAIGKDAINIALTGRPGTGKTTLANALAATFGLPIWVAKNSDDTESDEFEGKTVVSEGNFSCVPTAFTNAFEYGGIVVDEEYNLTKPGIKMGAIGQAIEAPYILKKWGYKDITRHPFCIYVATSNAGTEGSKETNQALASRMQCTYILDDPDDESFIRVLLSHDSEYKKSDAKKVLSVYKKMQKHLVEVSHSEDLALRLTVRQCIGCLDTLYETGDLKYACETSFVGKIAEIDPAIAEELKTVIVDNLR